MNFIKIVRGFMIVVILILTTTVGLLMIFGTSTSEIELPSLLELLLLISVKIIGVLILLGTIITVRLYLTNK